MVQPQLLTKAAAPAPLLQAPEACESLEAAHHAHPGADVVQQAAAEVKSAQRFKRQLRSLRGPGAEGRP
jgi:hypothetical protein